MSASPVDSARALKDVAAAAAQEGERDAKLSPTVVAALASADLFRLCVPASLGGREASVQDVVGAIEALSEGDGAAGWCLMIAATAGLISGWLPQTGAREVFGASDAPCGGVFAPRGRAIAVDGGYRVSGRWAFSSGVTHSAWMLGGCLVSDRDRPRALASGAPDVHVLAWRRESLRILDTWSVTGLRGTGSHDMEIEDVMVPERRAVSLFSGTPVASGPLYAFPVFGLLAVGVAAVALGVARAALEDFATLAGAKTPSLSRRSLAEHPAAQSSIAHAQARVVSARAFLDQAVGEAWAEAVSERQVGVRCRVALRLASTHAAAESVGAVDAVHHAAGGSSIYRSSPLERRFRDVHTLRQHMIVGPSTWELAGRALLGAEVDTTML